MSRPDADTVKRLTGYAIGGIPPLAHDTLARVLMDPHLLEFDIVGLRRTPHAVFGIAADELRRVRARNWRTSLSNRLGPERPSCTSRLVTS